MQGLVRSLKLKFGQYFAANIWLRVQSFILAKIMMLGSVKILSFSFVDADVWLRFYR